MEVNVVNTKWNDFMDEKYPHIPIDNYIVGSGWLFSDEYMKIWNDYKEQYPIEELLNCSQEIKDDMRKRSQEIMT